MPTVMDIARYIIDSPHVMFEDGTYFVHYNLDVGLNYEGNCDPNNITVCVPIVTPPAMDNPDNVGEFLEKYEKTDNQDFMYMCELLHEKLVRELEQTV